MTRVVTTASGKVAGHAREGVISWKGIPYAAAPIGQLRFAPTGAAPAWDGIRDGGSFGPVAVQPIDPLAGWMPEAAGMLYPVDIVQSEDCLFLNVWASETHSEPKAVYVWLHGGAFVSGSSSAQWTEGHNLALQQDVVVVSITYRLGVFGGLALDQEGTGANNFLLDVLAGLGWVQQNIAGFGGDPSRVTIGGESAGAMIVGALFAMPSAVGLFHQAIVQSGHGQVNRHATDAWRARGALLAELGIPEGDGALDRLRKVDAETILRAQEFIRSQHPAGPIVDGTSLLASPMEVVARGEQPRVPLLIGSNRDEHKIFELMGPVDERSLRERIATTLVDPPTGAVDTFAETYLREGGSEHEAWILFATDRTWRRPVRDFARFHSDWGVPVYRYELNYRSPVRGGILAASHSVDIPFPFANLDKPGVDDFLGTEFQVPGRGSVETQCSEAWGSFIRDGVPRSTKLPAWPQYSRTDERLMVLAPEPHLIRDGETARTALWDIATVLPPFARQALED